MEGSSNGPLHSALRVCTYDAEGLEIVAWCLATTYLDDIGLYADTVTSHLARIGQTLEALKQEGRLFANVDFRLVNQALSKRMHDHSRSLAMYTSVL